MALTQALCNQAKVDFLSGVHSIATDTLRLALFTSAATLDASTLTYTGQAGEFVGTGGYVAGGAAPASAPTVTLNGTTATLDTGDFVWANLSGSGIVGALLYNDSKPGKPAIAVFAFPSSGATNSEFRIQTPTGLITYGP